MKIFLTIFAFLFFTWKCFIQYKKVKIWFFKNQSQLCDIELLGENMTELTYRFRSMKLRFCNYAEFLGPEFVEIAIQKKNTISHELLEL